MRRDHSDHARSAAPMMSVVAPRNSVNTLNSERACASCGSSAILASESREGSKAADSRKTRIEGWVDGATAPALTQTTNLNVLYLPPLWVEAKRFEKAANRCIHASKCFATFRCATVRLQRFAAFYLRWEHT